MPSILFAFRFGVVYKVQHRKTEEVLALKVVVREGSVSHSHIQ